MKSLIKNKTIISGLLLLLMFVINGVKLLHKHDDSHTHSKSFTESKISFTYQKDLKINAENTCTICEYHFAKDTDLTYFFNCITPLIFLTKKDTPNRFLIFSRLDKFISGRAPPAFV